MPGQQRLPCLHYYNQQVPFLCSPFLFLGIALDISGVYVNVNK